MRDEDLMIAEAGLMFDQMKRTALVALSLFVAGCATGAVRTPEQAKAIALSSVCAQRQVNLAPHETMPTGWVAERKGDRWYVSLPFGPGAQYSGIIKYGHMGAWIDAKDGKVLSCEGGASRPLGQIIAARSFHAAF